MNEFRFEDVIVAANADDLQGYLADAHANKIRPLCMCLPGGVPMYVAKVGEHYAIKRMPNTGGTHDPDCTSYDPPAELSGLGEVKGEAIQENVEDGTTTLRLDFSLSKTGGKAAPAPSGVAADTVRTDGAKLTLRGTLHYLWEEAQLNRWYPAMEGKRSWYVVRISAAGRGRESVQRRAAGTLAVCARVVLVGTRSRHHAASYRAHGRAGQHQESPQTDDCYWRSQGNCRLALRLQDRRETPVRLPADA